MKLGFILEDHAGAQDWLRDVLKEVFPEISVTVANRLTEARDKLSHLQQADLEPDIALIDLSLPDGNGIDFIRDLREAVPECLCIVITIHDDDRHVFPALRAGARGYLLKQHPNPSWLAGWRVLLTMSRHCRRRWPGGSWQPLQPPVT